MRKDKNENGACFEKMGGVLDEENERKRRSEVVHIVNREVEPINKD